MTAKEPIIKPISMANTKKEMLEAYETLKQQLEEQAKQTLKPEQAQKAKTEQKVMDAVEKAVASEDITRRVYDLKDEIGRFLADMAAKIEKEKDRYTEIKKAVEIRDAELKDIYEIEKSAHSLAALLEAQNLKKAEFESEMARQRETLADAIATTRLNWEKEKDVYNREIKEQKAELEKQRKREKEEFEYSFNREKELKKQQLNDEIEKLNKQLQDRREAFEKEVAQRESDLQFRENQVAEREKVLDGLQAEVDAFPAELEKRVLQAVRETTEKLKNEAKKNEEILIKGYEGEKNVLTTKIQSLEKLVADQQKQIEMLSRQMDNVYGKVQEIAMKAVSGKEQVFVGHHPKGVESSEKI